MHFLATGCNPGCQNGGFCNGNVCQCLGGYTGTLCETRGELQSLLSNHHHLNLCLDYCLPNNPCQNGGRCVSNAVNYQCDCTGTGYTGSICTEAIVTGEDDFLSQIVVMIVRFVKLYRVDPCLMSPCQNGGQCSFSNGQVFCQCFNGYIGLYCQFLPGRVTDCFAMF